VIIVTIVALRVACMGFLVYYAAQAIGWPLALAVWGCLFASNLGEEVAREA